MKITLRARSASWKRCDKLYQLGALIVLGVAILVRGLRAVAFRVAAGSWNQQSWRSFLIDHPETTWMEKAQ
jgi:hypothetical protein